MNAVWLPGVGKGGTSGEGQSPGLRSVRCGLWEVMHGSETEEILDDENTANIELL